MPRPLGTPLTLSLLLVLGITLGSPINRPGLWLIAAIIACAAALLLTRRAKPDHPAPALACLAAWTFAAAAWGALHLHAHPPDDIARYVHPDRPRLIQVRGLVEEPILTGPPPTGPMAEFFHQPPCTTFRLRAQAIGDRQGWQPASGSLLVRIAQVDRRLHAGQSIETTGWLKPLSSPRNPGEFDSRPLLQRDGVQGRLALGGGDDWQPAPSDADLWPQLRALARQRARSSLLTGLPPEGQETSLLDCLLLGSSARPIADIYDDFRELGLAHLLAISGAHLMILLWFVWWVAKGVTHRPALAGSMVLLVLLSYLFILPGRAAILRAGIMSGLYGLAYLTGWSYRWREPEPRSMTTSLPEPGGVSLPRGGAKRAPLFELWSISVILVLLWRPAELFEPGTQLSFGVVAGLILLGPKVRRWLSPNEAQRIQRAMGPTPQLRQPSLIRLAIDHTRQMLLDFLAASLIALIVAGPIVAYHFQIITPLALPLGLVMAPLVTAALVLGYLKMMLGLLLPGAAGWLVPAGALERLIRGQIDLAAWAADLPVTRLGAIHLPRQPSLAWTFAALALGTALLSGRFKRRPILLTTAVLLCTLWLSLESFLPRATWPAAPDIHPSTSGGPTIKLTALDLGPGRCLIVQAQDGSSRHTALIDAGSRQWSSVSQRAIVPALTELGVRRIDTLILTGPTLEHLSGVIDLARHISIHEAWITPQVEAHSHPGPEGWATPASLALAELRRQGVPVKVLTPGDNAAWAGVKVAFFGSSAEPSAEKTDPPSAFALRLQVGENVALLGDAWPEIFATEDSTEPSRPTLVEWPHRTSHRSDLESSLRAHPPQAVLLQGQPLANEAIHWQPIWAELGIETLSPHQRGATQATLDAAGRTRWTYFLPSASPDLDEADEAAPATPEAD